ncbi:unnamed protein product [Rhodiola kirilowii]
MDQSRSEIVRFIQTWLIVYFSLTYCFLTAKLVSPGKIRFLLISPVVCLFLLLPLRLTSIHLGGSTAFFISWLATFKLILLSFNKGPLSSDSNISLLRFIAAGSLPIKIIPKSKLDAAPRGRPAPDTDPGSQIWKPAMRYAVKAVLLAVVCKLYDFTARLHPTAILFLYCFHIYFLLEFMLAVVGVAARAVLGLELEPQFNEPYLATSLKDFWGKRWNLAVTSILRLTVYEPTINLITGPICQLSRNQAEPIAVLATFGMEDPESTLRPVASYLRPKLHNAWKDKRKALFTENSDKIRRVIDNLQKKLDEPFLNIQLYEKALDLFEEDPPTSVILHKHLLRTIAASIVEVLLVDLDKHNKLKNGIEVEETSDLEIAPLGPGDRISIAKGLPGSLSTKALTVVETLEGKRVEAFTTAMRDVAEECGLSLKKLDKKLERTLLHSYRKVQVILTSISFVFMRCHNECRALCYVLQSVLIIADLTSQVSAEADPVPLLPKVVSLLYVQVYSRALQAPGRAINACITRLEDKLDASSYKILLDYHRATVTLLALMSASVGDEEDCTSDRTLTKRELLESLMPSLKSLVLNPKPTAKT